MELGPTQELCKMLFQQQKALIYNLVTWVQPKQGFLLRDEATKKNKQGEECKDLQASS